MHLGIVAGERGWHVRDLERASLLSPVSDRGHAAFPAPAGSAPAEVADTFPAEPVFQCVPGQRPGTRRSNEGIARSAARQEPRPPTVLPLQTTFLDITQLTSADDLLQFDALLLRTIPVGSLEQTIFRLALLYRAERAGLRIINTPACFEACVDKFTTTARLDAADITTPKTRCCQTMDAAMAAFETLGRDVVIKPLFGSEGKGLVRVTDTDAAWRAISMLVQLGAVVYLQEFLPHQGYDLRAFVLGDQVLCAMKRSHAADWRTNLARGATAEAITLSEEAQQLALAAVRAVGAEIAGVDLLPTQDGRLLVLEVNGVPGWQGLAKATGVDVARKVLEFCTQRP